MRKLTEGLLLYHGSYTAIPKIDLSKCYKGLDFGKGFYVTSSYEQALSFVPNSIKKNIRSGNIAEDFSVEGGQISVFQYHAQPELITYLFEDANVEWLHLVAANRNSDLFPGLLNQFSNTDIVGGKIADDRTAATLVAYIAGAYGVPGEAETDQFTINRLLPDRLEAQFCFKTEKSIQSLEFIRSDRYGDVHRP